MLKTPRKPIIFIILIGIIIFLLFLTVEFKKDTKNSVYSEKNACEKHSVTDIDGNTYKTIYIGNKCWMAENLKTTTYKDGTPIPKIKDHNEWWSDTEGSYALYDHTFPFYYPSKKISSDQEMLKTYGLLYNFYAVTNPSGLCPEGWKIPSDKDWKNIEKYLGMSITETQKKWYRGENVGSKLAGKADLWNKNGILGEKFDISGFKALPAGYRRTYGDYGNLGSNANFWTSDEQDEKNAKSREIFTENKGIYRIVNMNKNNGLSVRCMKK